MSIEDPKKLEQEQEQEPETETAIEKPLSISEQIKAKEKQIEELAKLAGTDFWVSADSDLLLSWERQIEALKSKLKKERQNIDAEFAALFYKIFSMPEIKGSAKVFSPRDVVDSIQEVEKINRDHKYDRFNDLVVAIDRVTRTEGIRDKVKELILKRRSL